MEISPLAPTFFPKMYDVRGVRFLTAQTGIKYQGRDDLLVVDLVPGSVVAGCFTTSLTAAACIDDCRKSLAMSKGRVRAIVVNAGNANAFTGRKGDNAVAKIVDAVAEKFSAKKHEVYTSSTGVIGEALDGAHIVRCFEDLKPVGFEAAAQAIMTTDTFAKGATTKCVIDNQDILISGFAKGSGMIAPNMATMLSYIFTDVSIRADVLQKLVNELTEETFNSITVDSDTSTNDTVMVIATNQADNNEIRDINAPRVQVFKDALRRVMKNLALQIVQDGEGAQKLIKVTVNGATSKDSAKKIALTIANSPLVKTAIAGEDANWGRIVAAIGKSGERVERDLLSISIGGVLIAEKGEAVSSYREEQVSNHMTGRDILIEVHAGVGEAFASVWTCDLTHGYIEINADYRS